MRIIKRYSALILPFIFSTTVLATEPKEDRLIVGSFSSGVMENWEVKDFKGKVEAIMAFEKARKMYNDKNTDK